MVAHYGAESKIDLMHQENSKMLSHAYLYLFALVLKIRSFFSYLGLKFIR